MISGYYLGILIVIFLLIGGLLVKNLFRNRSHSSTLEESMEKKTEDLNRENLKEATLAGGCFWCMEPPFVTLEGVEEVIAGYTGGEVEDPTYEEVSTGDTGHYEAVKICYDPEEITFEEILDVYWKHIDPIDPGGQFADRGSQYETAIFFQNEEQKKIAEESKQQLEESGKFDHPVVTKILPAREFYPAEGYHQNYSEKNPDHYESYKKLSGREEFIEKTWKNDERTPEKSSNKYEEFEKPGDEKLKKKLSPLQYEVTQENGTEKAFQNEYYDNKKEGIYVDIVSGEPLFSSTDKFESGSGWPSFTRPLEPTNVVEIKDTSSGMVRTEVRSKHGDSHLGHVFDDGPEPTGRRYCVNSAALEFIPVDELAERGYEEYEDLFSREN